MTQTRPNRPGPKPKSIVLRNGTTTRVYRTFEDWQAAQDLDKRTPEQRGIKVGGPVMWRHRNDGIITTDRATVVAITANIVTIRVSDVVVRTCDVDVCEIVNSDDDRMSLREANRRMFSGNQAETPTV